MENKTYDVKKE